MSPRKTKKKQAEQLKELEKLAQRVGIKVSYSDMKFAGLRLKSGQCLFKGRHWLVLNRKDHFEEKVDLFRETLENFDLTGEELSPELAKIISLSSPLN
jgi:hypothetical protein